MNRVAIFGAGGLGGEVLSLITALDAVEPVCFVDDAAKPGTLVRGVPVAGGIDVIHTLDPSVHLVIALGDPREKARVASICIGLQRTFLTLIHPSVIIQHPESVRIGAGAVIQAGSILTNDIVLGLNVLVNLNCTIGHDVRIGDNTSVMPGANLAGKVVVGESVLIGSGTNIINGVTLGDRCRIGAGAAVIADVPAEALAVGVPAIIKQK